MEPSDEEVLAESDDFSSSSSPEDGFEDNGIEPVSVQHTIKKRGLGKPLQDSDDEGSTAPAKDDEVEGWGTSKQDYYDADIIETEADALEEEKEARRLQQKQLQDMTEADFGFDSVDWLEADGHEEEDQEGGPIRREILPKLEITDAMGVEERTKIMRMRYPELEPLAKEFLDLQAVHQALAGVANEAVTREYHDRPANGLGKKDIEHVRPRDTLATLKYRALSAYLGSLSMYFALLTSGARSSDTKGATMPPEELRDHTVMDTLVQCRDLWERARDVLPETSSRDQEAAVDFDQVESDTENGVDHSQSRVNGHKEGESQPISNEHTSKHQKKRIRKAERLALLAQEEANARRQERLRQTELSLESLPDFTKTSSKVPSSQANRKEADDDNDSDFGDATSLTAHEAAEKVRRKKSLKFYTSQIAQKSNKRGGAGRDAGGDVDVPHRERLRDRQERLNAEAERRGKKPKASSAGAALGHHSGEDEGDEPTNAERGQIGNASDSDNEYYDLVAKRAHDRKASKAANNAIANAAAAQSGSLVLKPNDIALDADGKRAITYAIEKNKGLHPHRKKDVRNPRVKKRKKFEEKKKKLGSVRAVYKGDREGKGGYGGEKTGIKRGLVRSIKL